MRVTDQTAVLDALEERMSWQERVIAVDVFKGFLAPQAGCLLALLQSKDSKHLYR